MFHDPVPEVHTTSQVVDDTSTGSMQLPTTEATHSVTQDDFTQTESSGPVIVYPRFPPEATIHDMILSRLQAQQQCPAWAASDELDNVIDIFRPFVTSTCILPSLIWDPSQGTLSFASQRPFDFTFETDLLCVVNRGSIGLLSRHLFTLALLIS